MKKVKGVKRYAKQFVSTVDMGEVPRAIEQMGAVAGLMDRNKVFRNIMVGPVFSDEEVRKIIGHLGTTLKMSEKTTKYLLYLSEAGAFHALSEIVDAVTALYLEMKKKAKVVVSSPVKISKAFEENLISSLKRLTGREVEMEFVLDPSLLGGVRLQVGSTMYDSSIKGQLGLLRDKLIKG